MNQRIGIDLTADFSELDKGFDHAEKRTDAFTASVKQSGADIASSSKKMSDSLEMSAKATQNALRMVPAQMTDIFTQLQGGQSPFTVLIQQGGQLKDMFGGIGPAARAVGTYLMGMVSPLALAAGGVGVLAYAFTEGRAEIDEYNKALIMTGNATGTTVKLMQNSAYQIAASTQFTQGAAADALTQLAATGKVSADSLDLAARAALDLQHVGGAAVADTVKEFAALGGDPVTAVLRLNDQYHFLTGAVYEQIKALSESGQATEAAKLAIDTYASAIEGRIPALNEKLGTLQKAWIGVKDFAKEAWGTMLGFGRQPSIDAQIASLQKEIDLRKKPKSEAERDPALVGMIPDRNAQLSGESLDSLEIQLRTLQSMRTAQTQLAEHAQHTNEINAAGLFIARKKEESLSKQERLEREITAIRANAALAGTSKADVDKLIAAAEEEYKDHSAKKGVDYLKLMSSLSGLDANYQEELKALYKAYEQGKIGIDDYRMSVEQLIQKQPFAIKLVQDEKKAREEQQKVIDAQLRAEEQAGKAMTEFDVQTGNRVESIQRQIELLGKTPEQAAQINAFGDIDRQADALLLKLKELRANIMVRGGDTTRIDDLIAKLPQLSDLAKGQAAEALRDLKSTQDDLNASWKYGAAEALRKYLDEVQNVAAKSEQAMTNAFKGMDDALVEWEMTGKLSSKNVADAIIRDLLRIENQASITGPLAQYMKDSGGLSGLLGSFFGGSETPASGTGGAFAKGGVFTDAPDLHRYVNTVQKQPTYFKFGRTHAFASGGVFAEETPEAVMPLGKDSKGRLGVYGMGGGNVTVNVINNASGTKATQTQRNDGNGTRIIEVVIDQIDAALASNVTRGTGKLTSAMENRFGLNRAVGAF